MDVTYSLINKSNLSISLCPIIDLKSRYFCYMSDAEIFDSSCLLIYLILQLDFQTFIT